MPTADYTDHLFQLGQQTIKQLRQHELGPTPQNYTLWLTAVQGYRRELSAEFRKLQTSDGRIDQDDQGIVGKVGRLHVVFDGGQRLRVAAEMRTETNNE